MIKKDLVSMATCTVNVDIFACINFSRIYENGQFRAYQNSHFIIIQLAL